ncbi:MAG: acetylglutamate kinase [Nitrospirae bacterium]|uniref:Acetylglutamate kinase n=1 Tax=Leptospirillum ferrodiazotrophum TaxID=412449 RepID=C6HWV3_9BACT|nr:MAG: acetylglutamate kinase [Leptospirillum ferrodiazotrophum]MCL5953160.1 acetylglutamate kinase [Nitrospirota bacterium]
MESIHEKAQVLIDALPYIRTFHGKTFVIKFGGGALDGGGEESLSFAQDLVLLQHIGIRPVVVHGGGPQISSLMGRLGMAFEFVNGIRVTGSDAMEVVEMVLTGRINREIVTMVHRHGGRAVGISGRDAGFLVGTRKVHDGRDLGHVGEIVSVNPEILDLLDRHRYIPIVAPVGVTSEGEALNINADEAAAVIAGALKAEKLIMMTNTRGVLDDKGELLGSLDREEILSLIGRGVIAGGMVPKMQGCLRALAEGVGKVHVIDGRIAHALLLEIFTPEGVGTEIVRGGGE